MNCCLYIGTVYICEISGSAISGLADLLEICLFGSGTFRARGVSFQDQSNKQELAF